MLAQDRRQFIYMRASSIVHSKTQETTSGERCGRNCDSWPRHRMYFYSKQNKNIIFFFTLTLTLSHSFTNSIQKIRECRKWMFGEAIKIYFWQTQKLSRNRAYAKRNEYFELSPSNFTDLSMIPNSKHIPLMKKCGELWIFEPKNYESTELCWVVTVHQFYSFHSEWVTDASRCNCNIETAKIVVLSPYSSAGRPSSAHNSYALAFVHSF